MPIRLLLVDDHAVVRSGLKMLLGSERDVEIVGEASTAGEALDAAAAVRALREDHAQLRRHLETLGVAAPEQDPAGCVAELRELGALLRSHHAAEMALDPQYATRPGPRLALSEPAAMDLRGLRPPEPMVRIFDALERNPGAPLRVILPHEPVPLYALLRERGFSCSGAPRADGGFELVIERS